MIQVRDKEIDRLEQLLVKTGAILVEVLRHPLGHMMCDTITAKHCFQESCDLAIELGKARRGYPNDTAAGGGL